MPYVKTRPAIRGRYRRSMYRRLTRRDFPGRGAKIPRAVQKPFGEIKFADTISNNVDFTSAGLPLLLNGSARGPEIYQRIGRQIFLKSLQVRLNVAQQNGALNEQTWRYTIVYDRQCNGTATTTAGVFDLAGAPSYCFSQLNMDNRDRYLVLRDRVLKVSPPLDTDGTYNLVDDVPLNLFTTYNSGNTGTVTDIASGALYLILNCQAPLGLINLKLYATTRCYYYDV